MEMEMVMATVTDTVMEVVTVMEMVTDKDMYMDMVRGTIMAKIKEAVFEVVKTAVKFVFYL